MFFLVSPRRTVEIHPLRIAREFKLSSRFGVLQVFCVCCASQSLLHRVRCCISRPSSNITLYTHRIFRCNKKRLCCVCLRVSVNVLHCIADLLHIRLAARCRSQESHRWKRHVSALYLSVWNKLKAARGTEIIYSPGTAIHPTSIGYSGRAEAKQRFPYHTSV